METVGSEGYEAQDALPREEAQREGGGEARRPTLSQSRRQHARRQEEDGLAKEDELAEEVGCVNEGSFPVTPDGRYFVVRGRLWRCANPSLAEAERRRLVQELMTARRAVAVARKAGDAAQLATARAAVDAAKRGLGERGPVWWTDGAPDYNRHLARNTPYAEWYASLDDGRHTGSRSSP